MQFRHQILFLTTILIMPLTSNAQLDPANVVTSEVTQQLLAPSVELPGTVVSREDARLASELNANLAWIAEVGTEVSKGDTVARLQDFTFKVQEMEAQSRVDREQANVSFLEAELARLTELQARNLSAKSQLDQTAANLEIARGDLRISEAQLGYAKISMHVTQIRAPFDGIVTERLRSVGERLRDADEVIRIVNASALEVVARAPLSTANFVAKGDELHISNDFRSDSVAIRTIVPFGDPQSHMLEIRLDADGDKWTVGESVRILMPTSVAKEVLAVPRDALVLRRDGVKVFKVNEDSTVTGVNVIVGLGAGADIEIIGDLGVGDRVVTRGAEGLQDGMAVDVIDGPR